MNVWKTRDYTSDHGGQLTANSKSLVQQQRRTDDQVSWIGNVGLGLELGLTYVCECLIGYGCTSTCCRWSPVSAQQQQQQQLHQSTLVPHTTTHGSHTPTTRRQHQSCSNPTVEWSEVKQSVSITQHRLLPAVIHQPSLCTGLLVSWMC